MRRPRGNEVIMEEMDFKELEQLLEEKKFAELHSKFLDMNSVDIAEFLGEIDTVHLLSAFRLLPKDISAEVFSYLDTEQAEHIVRSITDKELCRLVDDMFIDDTVDFLEEVPANVVNRVLRAADPETRKTINRYLNYAEDTAGSIMTNEMVQLHTRFTAKQAIENIRQTATDKETIYTCYCVDESRRLVGTVELKDLLLCDEDTKVGDIMDDKDQIISVNTSDDQEMVADLARKYDLLSVPVTDAEGRLVGIITIDDIVDIIEQENTEDFEKMAAMRPADETYLKTGVFKMAKNRILWLAILMVSATFTGQLMSSKESLLSNWVFLTTAIPMLMDTSGNAGNQVSTLMIRGLALGEIKIKDYFRVLFKEFRVAIVCALMLVILNFGRMWIMNAESGDIIQYLIVSAALFIAILIANAIGCSLPILMKLIHLDPALMAGPMMTTILDVTTLAVYFGIAQKVLLK